VSCTRSAAGLFPLALDRERVGVRVESPAVGRMLSAVSLQSLARAPVLKDILFDVFRMGETEEPARS
ncbi:hypothetical protein JXD38_06165, partial [candidate division WOR-3 bacterium]|nr:hypothetical protein [candidate division WOR-3 bacterium]